jgi:threonine/homoserine/homoserine lactone efflux protein
MGGELLAFLGISALVIVTPGQDTALTIRNTLAGGRRSGIGTALGVSTGQAAWTVAASAGVAALLVASEPAFLALKLAGAAYLVFLGAQALLAAAGLRRPRDHGTVAGARRLMPRAAFRQGIVSNLGNPKMAVFFTSLLPQFAPEGGASFAAMLALGLVFCSLTLAWLTGYAIAVARAGDFLRRPPIRRALDAATGLVLVGALALGVVLASDVYETGAGVDRLLFGSLIGVSDRDLWLTAGVAAAAVLLEAVARRSWLAQGFDPGTARALGVRPALADAVLLVAVTAAAVVALDAVGALLVAAVLVIPAATVRLVAPSVGALQAGTALLAAIEGVVGLWLAYELNIGPGPATAVLGGAVFALVAALR